MIFFLGAGFASLPEDKIRGERLQSDILQSPHPDSLDQVLAELIPVGNVDALTSLADELDDPSSEKPNLADTREFLQLESEKYPRGESSVLRWIESPSSALKLLRFESVSDYDTLSEDVLKMDKNVREALAKKIREYADYLSSESILENEVAEVESNSGLVKHKLQLSPSTSDTVDAVLDWSKVPWHSEASLSAIASNPRQLNLMARFSSGVTVLPFLDGATGKAVAFEVPKAMFEPPQSTPKSTNGERRESILDTLQKSVSREMVANLTDAANRNQETYTEIADIELPHLQRDMESALDKKAWLRKTREVTYQDVDERGRPTGRVHVEHPTNFRYWIDRLKNAEASRIEARIYKQSAKRLEELLADPKASAINNYSLLDSFLRGWELSFLDNSRKSPYRTWLETNRTTVWEEIFRQAKARGLNIEPIVSDQTVFQVRDNGQTYTIRPLYVGNYADTVATKGSHRSLVSYHSPWSERKVVYLKPDDVRAETWAKAQSAFAQSKKDGVEILAKETLINALKATRPDSLKEGIRRAIAIAPEYSATSLVQKYWEFWPDDPRTIDEARLFETLLKRYEEPTDAQARTVLGVADLNNPKVSRYANYVRDRAFEGGLGVMRCLSVAINLTDADGETRDSVLQKADTCFESPSTAEKHAISTLELSGEWKKIRDELKNQSSGWDFDALGRAIAQNDLNESIARIARPLLAASPDPAEMTKREVQSHVLLTWYTGNFQAAFATIVATVLQHNSSDEAQRFAAILTNMNMELLKALIYSGGQLGSLANDKVANDQHIEARHLNANLTHPFELRRSDFSLEPPSVHEIALHVALPEELSESVSRTNDPAPPELVVSNFKDIEPQKNRRCNQGD